MEWDVPDYEKSTDIFGVLQERMEEAVFHAEKLHQYHEDNGTSKLSTRNRCGSSGECAMWWGSVNPCFEKRVLGSMMALLIRKFAE